MKRRRWMPTVLSMVAAGSTLVNRVPQLKNVMSNINRVMPNSKTKRNRRLGGIIASGLVGYGLAKMMPKSKKMMG